MAFNYSNFVGEKSAYQKRMKKAGPMTAPAFIMGFGPQPCIYLKALVIVIRALSE
jgi:hypothetical protein